MVLPNTRFRVARQWSAVQFLRQKMTKTTAQNFSGTMPQQFIGGWTSDATYPATVVGDAMQVVGTGQGDIIVVMEGGTGNANLTVEIRVNGTPKTPTGTATGSGGTFTVPAVSLNNGDLITLWCTARSSTQRNISAASVTVVPL